MFLRRRRSERSSRGQALVETALVLPILALLMVMALDFGRVFFGWIALQNAARIGADFAAQIPTAWDGHPAEQEEDRDRYVQLVEDDLDSINCTLADGGAIPDPTFEDSPDTPTAPELDTAYNDGDYAVVRLECTFGLITPLAESILGGPVALGAQEKFPVNRRIVQGVPEAPPVPPTCPSGTLEVPDLFNLTMGDALDLWVEDGFLEDNFEPPVVSTGPPAGRNVNKLVTGQDLEENDCVSPTATVTVTHAP